MRVWDNGVEDEDTTYVCPINTTRSIACELLQSFMACRALMRDAKDNCGERVCKVLANSVFGMFGYWGTLSKRNDLYDAACYKTIAQIGRTNLLRAVIALDSAKYSIVYGDTDSLFVSGVQPTSEAERLAQRITNELAIVERRFALLDEPQGVTHAKPLNVVSTIMDFLLLFSNRPNVTTAWFTTSECNTKNKIEDVDPAASMWTTINRCMTDGSFRTVLFGNMEWNECRNTVRRMILDHFQGKRIMTTSDRRAAILSEDLSEAKAICVECKREEHVRPDTTLIEKWDTVINKVLGCEDRQCEMWHVEIMDW
ncbi:hypothetical protein CYMTET_9300 [Cymbomonas tetramitiformis]|uniref:DNA-directed DNA polymerase n=1 Tax=Cymbomonas tetramitiformis TaxID=36881 RepID=A0AAE0GRR0_9CHLO|nr:hypothetical protein CYMTET_9300 [Cymbomonas tetramitiformis]